MFYPYVRCEGNASPCEAERFATMVYHIVVDVLREPAVDSSDDAGAE